MLDSDASTAKTLTLVTIILQLIFFVIGIFGTLAFAAFFAIGTVRTTTFNNTIVTTSAPNYLGLVAVVFSAFFLIGLLWILLDYFLIYKKLAEEKVREAETPSIVLGIVQLIFAGGIPGILLIVAYVKIRDSLERSARQAVQNPPV